MTVSCVIYKKKIFFNLIINYCVVTKKKKLELLQQFIKKKKIDVHNVL